MVPCFFFPRLTPQTLCSWVQKIKEFYNMLADSLTGPKLANWLLYIEVPVDEYVAVDSRLTGPEAVLVTNYTNNSLDAFTAL